MTLESTSGIQAEWIILADHAEVVAGKLYLMGGAWDVLTLNNLPTTHPIGIGVSFLVPWNECNQPHPFEVDIVDPDGKELVSVSGNLEIGRPAGVQSGWAQRVPIAFNGQVAFSVLGIHAIRARIDGIESHRVRFNVVAGPELSTGPRDR